MELNWTTFVLEILNFLVLVWLLKHFFYKPVKGVIVRRQQGIEQQLQQADEKQRQAEALREQYENRLADWESEREAARQKLQHEIDEERKQRLVSLEQEIAAQREKEAVLAKRQQQEKQHQSEIRALELGARFVARLLESVASPEVETKLFEHLLDELKHLPPAQREALQSVVEGDKPITVQVWSAFPLSETRQKQLKQRIESRVPKRPHYEFHVDRKLLAGLRVIVGPWVLHANLHDELKSFAAIAHER